MGKAREGKERVMWVTHIIWLYTGTQGKVSTLTTFNESLYLLK